MEGQEVVRAVELAFEGGDVPPAAELVNDHCAECVETYRRFWSSPRGFVRWQEAAQRRGSPVETALLSPEAWRYYLPALIVWCVRDTKKVDVLVDNLVHQLTPGGPSNWGWFGPRSVGFTADQQRAIVHFLRWHQEKERAGWASLGGESPDRAAAAIRYWSRGS
jgi:hypothetical protein